MGGGDEFRMNSYQELTDELDLVSILFDLADELVGQPALSVSQEKRRAARPGIEPRLADPEVNDP